MRTMRTMKRMMAFLLALIMTMAMGVTAFAATKGTLTVKVNANNTLEGQTISVYKLFDLTVNGEGGYAYTVNTDYKDTLKTLLSLADTATDMEYFEAVKGQTDMQKFADDFTVAALEANISATATSEKIGKGVTEYKFSDLDYGHYLVYQTGTKELQSSLVSVDEANVEATLKGEAPSIDKEADKETVEIGQIVTYTITGTIPDTTGYSGYTYKIHDTLTDGLDFVEDTNGTLPTIPNYNVKVTLAGADATKTAILSGAENRTMVLDLSAWIRDNQASKGQEFTVTYYAKVNSDAVVDTNNSASLEYGNDPDNTITTIPDEVTTPTYPLDINKTDTESKMLAGATFRLYRTETDAKAANDDAIKVTGADGAYVVDSTSSNMDMVTVATGTGYNLRLNGLAAGTYWLLETKAPDGYNKLTAPVKVTITKDGANQLEWTVAKNDTVEDDKIIDIENSTGTMLPETGGMGTIMFTVIAIILAVGVVISFVISRRRKAE